MELTTEKAAAKLIKNGIIRPVSDLSINELHQYRQELKELIARIPDDEPEVLANFKEDLEDAEKAIKKFS